MYIKLFLLETYLDLEIYFSILMFVRKRTNLFFKTNIVHKPSMILGRELNVEYERLTINL